MMLQATDISYQYPGTKTPVIKDMSLAVESGERLGLFAPSGHGKTTLCKLLAGYLRPSSGEITLDQRPLSSYRGPCPVQMIYQHPELAVNPRLKLKKTLEEGGPLDSSILQGLGIEAPWLERYPIELSGGELQRFCIARALGPSTKFLLADEISTMLDLITQSQIWHFLLSEVQRRGIGLVAVSHNEELLQRICTRIVRLPVG